MKVNDKNKTQSYNRFYSYPLCQDDEIIVFFDGDDWLFDNHFLAKLNEIYTTEDILLTYGSYYLFINNALRLFHRANDFLMIL